MFTNPPGSVVAAISIVGQVALTRDPIPTPVGEHFANFTTPYEALSLTTSLSTTLFLLVAADFSSSEDSPGGQGHSYSKALLAG